MTLRSYLIIMALATALSWFAWGLVLVNVNPFQTSVSGFVFFYTSFFLALLGTLSMFRFGWYHFFSRERLPMFRYVEKSFRDGFLLAVVFVSLAYLRGIGLLHIWNFAAFLLCAVLFVLFRRTVAAERIDS